MDISASRCSSSGCESGWTLYLDQSNSFSKNHEFHQILNGNYSQGEEEEEDLSMISDASSGPPHYSEFNDDYSINHYLPNIKNQSNSKKKTTEFGRNQHLYDDTASSHVLSKKVGLNNEASRDNNVLEFSQGFSATHYKGKSSFKNHFGFFKSSLAEKQASKETGGFQGRKWK